VQLGGVVTGAVDSPSLTHVVYSGTRNELLKALGCVPLSSNL
jgi:hypothetical protein